MEKAYKFRIYPNKKQKEILAKTFGCCRTEEEMLCTVGREW